MAGRPLVITKYVSGKLRQAFLWGATDEEASAYAGIARSTLYNYQARNPEFLDKKRAWKLNPILKARKTLYENLDNPKTAMWYLERKRKDEFSLRYEQEIRNKGRITNVLDRQETNYDELGRQATKQLINH